MTVSFESKEEREAAAAARVLTPLIVERPKSEIQARRSLLIRTLALTKDMRDTQSSNLVGTATHPFQISVDEMKAVHICQTLRDVGELNKSVEDTRRSSNVHTSLMRFTLGFFRVKSLIFPFSIHCETIANRRSASVTPSSGRMFGCWRFFQATASLQNRCDLLVQIDVRSG